MWQAQLRTAGCVRLFQYLCFRSVRKITISLTESSIGFADREVAQLNVSRSGGENQQQLIAAVSVLWYTGSKKEGDRHEATPH